VISEFVICDWIADSRFEIGSPISRFDRDLGIDGMTAPDSTSGARSQDAITKSQNQITKSRNEIAKSQIGQSLNGAAPRA
jgi:hypothetical protein